MLNRFFKLLYVFGLIAIVLSLPIFIVTKMSLSEIFSYKVKFEIEASGLSFSDKIKPLGYDQVIENVEALKQQGAEQYEIQEYLDSLSASSSPKLYKLEKEIRYYEIYYPLITWFAGALLAFIILQILRISYIYIVFGKIAWHPFKSIKK